MELQREFRDLQLGKSSAEECNYYEGLSTCGSSFSSTSYSSSGPVTPSAMSSRRPSLAEDNLLYVTDLAADDILDSPMAMVTGEMTFGSSLKAQSLLSESAVDPSIFGAGLSITLQYHTTLTNEANHLQPASDFQWDDAMYRQTSQAFRQVGVDLTTASLLGTGDIPIDTRNSFQINDCPRTPPLSCQENNTIDPIQTQYLDTNNGEYGSSCDTTLFGTGSIGLPDGLYSPSTQPLTFLESSPGSSSDWSRVAQASLAGSTSSSAPSLSSPSAFVNLLFNEDVAIQEGQRARSSRKADKANCTSGYLSHADKANTGRVRKTSVKPRSKNFNREGISCTLKKYVKPQIECGHKYADGSVCPSKFERKEHAKRHRDTHSGRTQSNNCPDPNCNRSKDSFKGRADNRMQHIRQTHIKIPDNVGRNSRWNREQACAYGFRDEWDKTRGENPVEGKEKVQRPSAQARRKSKSSRRGRSQQ